MEARFKMPCLVEVEMVQDEVADAKLMRLSAKMNSRTSELDQDLVKLIKKKENVNSAKKVKYRLSSPPVAMSFSTRETMCFP